MKKNSGRNHKLPLRLAGIILAAVMLTGVFACVPAQAGIMDAIAEAAGEISAALQNEKAEVVEESAAAADEEAAAADNEEAVAADNEEAAAADNKETVVAGFTADRVEGPGFATKEDAALAYIDGLLKGDIAAMISACSIESYVDHYDLERSVERMGALQAPSMYNSYLPMNGEIERALNIETRRNIITQMIKYQYLCIMGGKAGDPDKNGMIVTMKDYDSAAALIEDYYTPLEEKTITFEGELVPAFFLENLYYKSSSQFNLVASAYVEGADQIGDVGALLYVNDKPFLLMLGADCFDGRWYITNNSMAAIMAGLMVNSGGIMAVRDGELNAFREQYALMQEDALLQTTLQHLQLAIDSIDTEAVMSLPNEERRDAYIEAYENAVREYLTEEEIDYLENIM